MDHLEPGSITLTSDPASTSARLVAVEPVNRDALRSFVASIRQTIFHGVQVPVNVTHLNPDTGEESEEHIPGCATCSI